MLWQVEMRPNKSHKYEDTIQKGIIVLVIVIIENEDEFQVHGSDTWLG
uniref:Uncharacterized protein n=1 Tax=Arundo donax TaxID=35708 RepID=A0A0A9BIP5_ARUDO